ncbi:MAG: hypothetical protein ACYCW6_12295 [Candidatus Xenobia bacterium]
MIKQDAKMAEFDDDDEEGLDPRRLIGVGVIGAVASMAIYYFYHRLPASTKEDVRHKLADFIGSQIDRIAEEFPIAGSLLGREAESERR